MSTDGGEGKGGEERKGEEEGEQGWQRGGVRMEDFNQYGE